MFLLIFNPFFHNLSPEPDFSCKSSSFDAGGAFDHILLLLLRDRSLPRLLGIVRSLMLSVQGAGVWYRDGLNLRQQASKIWIKIAFGLLGVALNIGVNLYDFLRLHSLLGHLRGHAEILIISRHDNSTSFG